MLVQGIHSVFVVLAGNKTSCLALVEAKAWITCKRSWETFKGFCPDVIFQKQEPWSLGGYTP